ncbi:MAG: heavy metal translocating P-type ATPase [Chloroflexi bacterium]|nr:heavy metal translocating P-type ATPase [Chloroflexota bacterium]MYK60779.1 heavy metal translocating P-type ATPase [Chloroflexota bacterium]
MVSKTIYIRGMTCAACVSHVTEAISSVPGVESAEVSLVTNSANVNFAGTDASVLEGGGEIFEAISAAVDDAGYGVDVPPAVDVEGGVSDRSQDSRFEAQRSELLTIRNSAIVSIGAMVLMMGITMARSGFAPDVPSYALNLMFLVIATPIQVGIAAPFYRSAWVAAKHKTSNMNTLVVVGTSVAFAYSTLVTISQLILSDATLWSDAASFVAPEHHTGTYFEVSAAIIGLVSLGRWLEGRTRLRASEAVRMLIELQPRTALVERADGVVEVAIDDIGIGETVVIRPGERVPTDARLVDGVAEINESMLTGESMPALKKRGDTVFAGTLNVASACKARVTTTGEATLLSQIIRQVERAQSTRAPIERFVDRVTARFVPAVLVAGLASFVFWLVMAPDPSLPNALLISVTVFVIACPCALGLATPTAVVAGIGRAAEQGILIKDATVLERTANVDTVAFDKTGTMTAGKPQVIAIHVDAGSGLSDDEVIRSAAAVEIFSEHPVATAIVSAARECDLEIPNAEGFQSITGQGVYARVDGAVVAVMNPSAVLLEENASIHSAVELIEASAQTPVTVSINGQLVGAIGLQDTVRDDAKAAVTSLRELGIETHLITGDRIESANAVARDVGIENVDAQVLPSEKATRVTELSDEGRRVAMIGDGINDGPALATADVGIAMASGSDIAIEAADVTLVNNEPTSMPRLISISRSTVRVIRQNLFWAFAYNVLLIPIAAGALHPVFADSPPPDYLRFIISESGFLSPVAAAAAMAFSSLSVSLNALRLRRSG